MEFAFQCKVGPFAENGSPRASPPLDEHDQHNANPSVSPPTLDITSMIVQNFAALFFANISNFDHHPRNSRFAQSSTFFDSIDLLTAIRAALCFRAEILATIFLIILSAANVTIFAAKYLRKFASRDRDSRQHKSNDNFFTRSGTIFSFNKHKHGAYTLESFIFNSFDRRRRSATFNFRDHLHHLHHNRHHDSIGTIISSAVFYIRSSWPLLIKKCISLALVAAILVEIYFSIPIYWFISSPSSSSSSSSSSSYSPQFSFPYALISCAIRLIVAILIATHLFRQTQPRRKTICADDLHCDGESENTLVRSCYARVNHALISIYFVFAMLNAALDIRLAMIDFEMTDNSSSSDKRISIFEICSICRWTNHMARASGALSTQSQSRLFRSLAFDASKSDHHLDRRSLHQYLFYSATSNLSVWYEQQYVMRRIFDWIYFIIFCAQFVFAFLPDFDVRSGTANHHHHHHHPHQHQHNHRRDTIFLRNNKINKNHHHSPATITQKSSPKTISQPHNVNPEDRATFLSKLTFTWFSATIFTGYRRPLTGSDIFPASFRNRVELFSDRFLSLLLVSRRKSKKLPTKKYYSSFRLIAVLAQQFGAEMARIAAIKLIPTLLVFLSPILLDRLISFLGDRNDSTPNTKAAAQPEWHGALYVSAIFFIPLLESLLNSAADYRLNILSLNIRSTLNAAIYERMLRFRSRSTAAAPKAENCDASGQLVNLMSIDTQRVLEYIKIVNLFWICPLQIAIAIALLWRQLRYGSLAGLAVLLLLLLPFNGFIGARLRALQSRLFTFRDHRIRLLHEAIAAMRAVKLHAYERLFVRRISRWREREIANLRAQANYSTAITFAFNSAPFLVAFASFASYLVIDDGESNYRRLDATKIFVSLAIFAIIRRPLAFFPQLITNSMMFMVSIKRIGEYLNLIEDEFDDEEDDDAESHDEQKIIDNNALSRYGRNMLCDISTSGLSQFYRVKTHRKASQNQQQPKASIDIDSYDFVWSATQSTRNLINADENGGYFALRDISISLSAPMLCTIIGEIGAGKSSLLCAILGQMVAIRVKRSAKKSENGVHCVDDDQEEEEEEEEEEVGGRGDSANQVERPANDTDRNRCKFSINGSIAYVPQRAWIQSGTIRENILFGAIYDRKWYRSVVEACALERDFEQFSDGDQTMVGQKGDNLSGGQKQRISIARALYANADIYLFDDPLSALDTQIAKHVFTRVIGGAGLLSSKIRLLVTHNMAILPRADRIVLMRGGRIAAAAHYRELMSSENAFTDFLATLLLSAPFAAGTEQAGAPSSIVPRIQSPRSIGDSTIESIEPDDREIIEEMATRLERQFCSFTRRGSVLRQFSCYNSPRDIASDEPQLIGFACGIGSPIRTSPSANVPPEYPRFAAAAAGTLSFTRMISDDNGGGGGGDVMIGEIDNPIESQSSNTQIDLIDIESMPSNDSARCRIYIEYFRHVGTISVAIIIVCFAVAHAFMLLAQLWLSTWSSADRTEAPSDNVTLHAPLHSLFIAINRTIPNDSSDTRRSMSLLAIYGAFSVAQAIGIVAGTLAVSVAGLRAARRLHTLMLLRLFGAPIGFFNATTGNARNDGNGGATIAQILNRATKDIDIADTALIGNFLKLSIELFRSAALFGPIIIGTDPAIVGIFAPLTLLYVAIFRYCVRTARQMIRLEAASRTPIYGSFTETYDGAAVIRAFGAQNRFIQRFRSIVNRNAAAYHMSIVAGRWLTIRLELLGNLVVLCTAAFCVAKRGSIDPGTVGLAMMCATAITGTLNMLVRSLTELESNIVSIERVIEYTRLPQERDRLNLTSDIETAGRHNLSYSSSSLSSSTIDTTTTSSASFDDCRPRNVAGDADFAIRFHPDTTNPTFRDGTITIRDYTARYSANLEPCLRDLNIEIEHGQKVAIVGRTGAGKSSFALALFRLIEPERGAIYIGGRDIQQIGLHELRSTLTIIPQESLLFIGSLRENLDPHSRHTDAQIIAALGKVHLADRVTLGAIVGAAISPLDEPAACSSRSNDCAATLSPLLEVTLDERRLHAISAGQRQLLCLARTLLLRSTARSSHVLILDEATAAVDPVTDDFVHETIYREFADYTILSIVHRLDGVTRFPIDRVMVLDAGAVVEFDHPQALIADGRSTLSRMLRNQL